MLLDEETILDESILAGDVMCESLFCQHQLRLGSHAADYTVRTPCAHTLLLCKQRVAYLVGDVLCQFCMDWHDERAIVKTLVEL